MLFLKNELSHPAKLLLAFIIILLFGASGFLLVDIYLREDRRSSGGGGGGNIIAPESIQDEVGGREELEQFESQANP